MPPRKSFRSDKNRTPDHPKSGSHPKSGHSKSGRPNEGAPKGGRGDERREGAKPAAKPTGGRKHYPQDERRKSPGKFAEHRTESQKQPDRDRKFTKNDDSDRYSARKPQREPFGTPREAGKEPIAARSAEKPHHSSGPKGSYWLYGHHAVLAAIDNPKRRIRRLVQSDPSGQKAARGGGDRPLPAWETVDRPTLDRLAGRESVHQGVAAYVEPLPELEIEDIAALIAPPPDEDVTEEISDTSSASVRNATIVILDQVTDPHNVGAILRSAAAFGALAVVLTERHAAPETGVLAKAASGALDLVPLVRVGNLARAMEQLKEAGFWCVGLAGEADRTLAQARLSGKVALCLGAEGAGLRRLTRAHCDLLAKLPTSGPIEHLNVSNAAAVALYELARGNAAE